MSKRETGELAREGHSVFIKDLEGLGYLPEAVVNWIALMGWSYDDHTEFFTLEDLVQKFSLEKLNPSPAAINFSKLDYFNGLHIRSLAISDLAARVKPFFEAAGYRVDFERLLRVTPLIQERMVTLDDGPVVAGFFFRDQVEPEPEDLVAKGLTPAQSAEVARRAYETLASLPNIKQETAEPHMRALVEELGLSAGQVFGILRVAVTGQKASPPLFESMEIIGLPVVLERVQKAVRMLEALAEKAG